MIASVDGKGKSARGVVRPNYRWMRGWSCLRRRSALTPSRVELYAIRKRWPWVKHLFADSAYDRLKLMDNAAYLDLVVEIIRRSDDQREFEVLPRRWVVERTFGWIGSRLGG